MRRAYNEAGEWLCQNCQRPHEEHGGAKKSGACPAPFRKDGAMPHQRRWRVSTMQQFFDTKLHGGFE